MLPKPGDAHLLLARRLAITAALLALLGCAALSVDLAVLYPFVTKSPGPIWEACRDIIRKVVQPGETFANGWAIALLLMAFYAVDVARRRGLLRIAVMIFITGLMANVGKLMVARWRPKAFFDATIDGFSGGVLESFHGWMPLASLGYSGQSIPSGHTATAIVLGFVLCHRWPHARWAFIVLTAMSITQRLTHAHHYPSDCLWGASLACLVMAAAYHPRLAGSWFDEFQANKAIAPSRAGTALAAN